MGKARKITVAITMIILCSYFLAGLVGILPYNVDYIKQAVSQNQETLSTDFRIQAEGWKEVAGHPANEGNFRDTIVYEDNLYVVSTKANGFTIWQMDKNGNWAEMFTGVSGNSVAISDAKFVEYKDENADKILYVIITSADVYAPSTEFFGSYDGITWQSSIDNSKFLPDINNLRMDSFTKNGKYLYLGLSRKTTSYGDYIVRIYRWNTNDWTSGWQTLYDTSFARVSAMAVFEAPLPNVFTTVYFAVMGYDYTTYAGVYYFDQSDNSKGAIGLQSYYKKEVTAMTVYKNSLFLATTSNLNTPYLASMLNYSREPLRTAPALSGTVYPYQVVSSEYAKFDCFGIYNDYLYAGAFASNVSASIFKLTSKTYDKDSWQITYTTGELSINSLTVFNSKFYATTSGFYGNIFVYDEKLIYDNPVIQHTPVTEGFINTPTRITARVSDIDGISSVILTYQPQGRIAHAKSMNLVSGTGDYEKGGYVNGTYSTEIPEFDEPINISYSISAKDKDGNLTATTTYIISITKEKQLTFFGVDFRVLYLLAIALTLIIGYFAYGTNDSKPKKKNEWRSS